MATKIEGNCHQTDELQFFVRHTSYKHLNLSNTLICNIVYK